MNVQKILKTNIHWAVLIVIILSCPVAFCVDDSKPEFINLRDKVAIIGKTLEFTVEAFDPADMQAQLVYSAEGLPPGAQFSQDTRTFSWEPFSDSDKKTFRVTFKAANGQRIASRSMLISTIWLSEETQVTSDAGVQINPIVEGDEIVWDDYRDGDVQNYGYDILVKEEVPGVARRAIDRNPAQYGSRSVMVRAQDGNSEIYLLDLTTDQEFQVSKGGSSKDAPSICGDTIVWQDDRNGNWDIYMVKVMRSPIIMAAISTLNEGEANLNIKGEHFGDIKGSSSLLLMNNEITNIVSWSDSEIVCKIPTEEKGGVKIITSSGESNEMDINIEAASSDPVSGTQGAPDMPFIKAKTIAAREIALTWSIGRGDNIDGFVLKRNGMVLATLPADARSYNDSNLAYYREYSYRVIAYNSVAKTASFWARAWTWSKGPVISATYDPDVSHNLNDPKIGVVITYYEPTPTRAPVEIQRSLDGINFETISFGAEQRELGNSGLSLTIRQIPNIGVWVWSGYNYYNNQAFQFYSNSPVYSRFYEEYSAASGRAGGYPPPGVRGYIDKDVTANTKYYYRLRWSNDPPNYPPSEWSDIVYVTTGVWTDSIYSIFPHSGKAGDIIKIYGTFFRDPSSKVLFNDTEAEILSWDGSYITCSVPAGLPNGDCYVRIASDLSSGAGVDFKVMNLAVITEISPASPRSGNIMTISGHDFGQSDPGNKVVFDLSTYISPVSWSDTSITCEVPSLRAGDHTVSVWGRTGQSNRMSFNTIEPLPDIISISPVSGRPGDTLVLSGTDFGSRDAASKVFFGSIEAVAGVWSNDRITCTIPETSPGATQIKVVNNLGTSRLVTFNVLASAPVITGLSKESGSYGDEITILGSNFEEADGERGTVGFGGTRAVITEWQDTQIKCFVPDINKSEWSLSSYICVRNSAGESKISFTITSNWPTIDSVTPLGGMPGDSITILGSRFGLKNALSKVILEDGSNGLRYDSGILGWEDGRITCTIPQLNHGTYNIKVVTGAGVSSAKLLTITAPAPSITSISPASGLPGGYVTISGQNFGTSGTVYIGNATATASSWTGTYISCTVPTLAAGSYGARVATSSGSSNVVPFNITAPAPSITSISPASGLPGGYVTISGQNFGTSGTVYIGNATATASSWTGTYISCTVPTLAAGSYTVKVATSAGMSSPRSFIVNAQTQSPTIYSLSPATGKSYSSITINGANLGLYTGKIYIYGCNGWVLTPSYIAAWNPSTIKFTLPYIPAGNWKVKVVYGSGVSSNEVSLTVT